MTFMIAFMIALFIIHFIYLLNRCLMLRRLNKINNEIYKEFLKIGGKEWAEKTIKEMIRKIIYKVDKGYYV